MIHRAAGAHQRHPNGRRVIGQSIIGNVGAAFALANPGQGKRGPLVTHHNDVLRRGPFEDRRETTLHKLDEGRRAGGASRVVVAKPGKRLLRNRRDAPTRRKGKAAVWRDEGMNHRAVELFQHMMHIVKRYVLRQNLLPLAGIEELLIWPRQQRASCGVKCDAPQLAGHRCKRRGVNRRKYMVVHVRIVINHGSIIPPPALEGFVNKPCFAMAFDVVDRADYRKWIFHCSLCRFCAGFGCNLIDHNAD